MELLILGAAKMIAMKLGAAAAHTAAGHAVAGLAASQAASTLATTGAAHLLLHSSVAAVQHASMRFAWGVITTAAGGALLGAGGYALVHGAYTAYNIADKMEEAKWERTQTRYSHDYSSEVLFTYSQFTSDKSQLMPVYSLLNKMYTEMGHRGHKGVLKRHLS